MWGSGGVVAWPVLRASPIVAFRTTGFANLAFGCSGAFRSRGWFTSLSGTLGGGLQRPAGARTVPALPKVLFRGNSCAVLLAGLYFLVRKGVILEKPGDDPCFPHFKRWATWSKSRLLTPAPIPHLLPACLAAAGLRPPAGSGGDASGSLRGLGPGHPLSRAWTAV